MTDEPAVQQPGHSVVGGITNEMVDRLIVMEIPPNILNTLKLELGYDDRDISNLSYLEKVSYIVIFLCSKFPRYCLVPVIAVPVDRVVLEIAFLGGHVFDHT